MNEIMNHTEIEFGSLKVSVDTSSERARYTFSGGIDEFFHFKRLPIHTRPTIEFNLKDVRTFNSCGTREWIFFLRSFPATSQKKVLECSVVMFDQYNIVPQLFEGMSILSFYAPYFCPQCDREVVVLIQTAEHIQTLQLGDAPQILHDCKTPLEFDALEECYFNNFVKR